MATKTPRIKHLAKVEISDEEYVYPEQYNKDGIHEFTTDYGRNIYTRFEVPKKVGEVMTYTVTVEYLGEKQYKQTYQQRVKALASSEKRREKWEKEQAKLKLEKDENELVQRRNRIVNQIELAFVKDRRGAVDFITCDKCDAMATHLGLAYENPGSQVLDTDQITGAWCEEHNSQHQRPFKTKAAIACERLEFFYDGLRQIYVKPAEAWK